MISLTDILKNIQKKKKTGEFAINNIAEKIFRLLKDRFITAFLLQHFDSTYKIKIKINVSDFDFGKIILQLHTINKYII
jgi:hypothetical protein